MDIDCLIIESGGSDLAVAICAASLALADAGVPMLDLVAACFVVRCHGSTCRLLSGRQAESKVCVAEQSGRHTAA